MTYFHYIDIKHADPVSSLAISDRYVITGTMLGRVILSTLSDKKNTILSEFSVENITGIQFENDESFNLAIGDDSVLRHKINFYDNQITTESFIQKNYDDELLHKTRCEGCYIILAKSNLIMIHLPIAEGTEVNACNIAISIKNILKYTTEDITLQMTNYSVPFDFDGKNFLWVEFDKENYRNICIHNIETKITIKHKINKEFGHISFCKIINSSKILLVRLQNIIEIRTISEFKSYKTFVNIGEEVIAIDFYFNNFKIIINEFVDPLFNSGNLFSNNLALNGNDKQVNHIDPIYLKINDDKALTIKIESGNVPIKDDHQINEENLTIAVLDIDGNVNVWENYTISTKFNLYNIKELNDDLKKKHFFSMGYQYFIKICMSYYAISSDHGVFIFKKEI